MNSTLYFLSLALVLILVHPGTPAEDAANKVARYILNGLRTTHSVPEMVYSDNLQAIAQQCADDHALKDTPYLDPSTGLEDPQCPFAVAAGTMELIGVYALSSSAYPTEYIRGSMWTWYISQSQTMDFWTPVYKSSERHIAQMIWRSTTQFGCAISRFTSPNSIYLSCVFSPPLDKSAMKDNINPPNA